MTKKLEELTPQSRETEWSKAIAEYLPGARSEVHTIYDARADVVTDLYSCEVEWTAHFFESIGQSLLYSVALGRKPAVILLVRDKEKEQLHLGRCAVACAAAGVTFTWIDTNDPMKNIEELRHILCGWKSELHALGKKENVEGTLMALTAGKVSALEWDALQADIQRRLIETPIQEKPVIIGGDGSFSGENNV